MAKTTSIEWTDHTWTPVVGCDAVSPACANCYAATMAARLESMGVEKYRGVAIRVGGKGKWTGKVNFWEPELVKPLTVRKASRWFLTSMGDVAHDALTDEQIAEMFGVMAVAGAAGKFHREADGDTVNGSRTSGSGKEVPIRWPNYLSGPHTFMVLTKRTARMADLLADSHFRRLVAQTAYKWAHNRTPASQIADSIYPFGQDAIADLWPLPNAFIGCTAENQEQANLRLPDMAKIAAGGWKTFVSYEPALGPVEWAGWEFLKQLISGGESGHNARPSHPDWHRAVRDWAEAHNIPYLFKQHGAFAPVEISANEFMRPAPGREGERIAGPGGELTTVPHADRITVMRRVGKKAAGRLLDGRTWDEFPEVAR